MSKSIRGRLTVHLETSEPMDRGTVDIINYDDACCGCSRAKTSDRFTVAPVFMVGAPPAPTISTPARFPIARRFTYCQPQVAAIHLPSHRETYLRCCVFRI
ncbi:MAG: hypothetical protein ACUVR8_13560 [Acidobacteriota bacterium]